jgi:hypothetical protein
MSNLIEQGIVFIGRTFGLWFALSTVLSVIILIWSMPSPKDINDTQSITESFNFLAEWLRWYVTSQVQLPSIIGTIFINLAYEIKKSNRPIL